MFIIPCEAEGYLRVKTAYLGTFLYFAYVVGGYSQGGGGGSQLPRGGGVNAPPK
jgi:hypothetical protein